MNEIFNLLWAQKIEEARNIRKGRALFRDEIANEIQQGKMDIAKGLSTEKEVLQRVEDILIENL